MESIYDFQVKTIDGKEKSLADFRGQTLLIVNTASACGFTPQYKGLEELYKKYKDKNFTILTFPCNQFGQQEKGTEAEIKSFCELNYGVSFPLFSKIDVKGPGAHPLYRYLTQEKPGVFGLKEIKWNFTKFLIDSEGHVVQRFAPTDGPESMRAAIEKLIG